MSQYTNEHRSHQRSETESILVNAYLDCLLVMGRQAAEICAPAGVAAQETLLRLRRRLAYNGTSAQDFSEAHDIVHATMRDFSRRAKELFDSQEVDYTNLQLLASRVIDSKAARDRDHGEQIRDIMRNLQNALLTGEAVDSQRVCEEAAFQLLRICDTFQDESARSDERWRTELSTLLHHRQEAIESATTDPETGLYSRAEMEKRVRDSLTQARQFCILKLGLHEFSGIAERHGAEVTRLIRKSAADKLSEQVRPRDVLGQWDDRTFLLIFYDCALATASLRADEISQWLSGDYRLFVNEQVVHADVQLTAAATEVRPDEEADAFVERAEALSPVLLSPPQASSLR